MKRKLLLLLFTTIFAFSSLTGCETAEEKARREIDEANAAYEKEKEKLLELQLEYELNNALIDYYENQ